MRKHSGQEDHFQFTFSVKTLGVRIRFTCFC